MIIPFFSEAAGQKVFLPGKATRFFREFFWAGGKDLNLPSADVQGGLLRKHPQIICGIGFCSPHDKSMDQIAAPVSIRIGRVDLRPPSAFQLQAFYVRALLEFQAASG